MIPAPTISPAYLAEQRQLHAGGSYGVHGAKWAEMVAHAAVALKVRTVLDYGCGQGHLVRELRGILRHVAVSGFDPAVPFWAGAPEPADLVVCIDVLEHVEPDRLDAVLAHLAALAQSRLLVVVATRCASKWLRDGRNAHLTIALGHWWAARLAGAGFSPAERVKSPVANLNLEWLALLRPPVREEPDADRPVL